MPRKILPRIVAVSAGDKPFSLRVRWDREELETQVDLSRPIAEFRVYEGMRDKPALFNKAVVGDLGTDVIWPDGSDMSADTIWRLAQEQSHATLSAAAFRNWRESHRYTLDGAAKALGVSRRMVAYYEEGKRPVPRVVALATKGLEAG